MARKKIRKKKKIMSWRAQILSFVAFVTAIVFMPSTALLLFGMMPTIVVAAFDTAKKKPLAMTVGAMNLSGCIPFLFYLWSMGHSLDNAVVIVSNLGFMIIMWSMAGVGYLVDWSLSGMVAKVMVDRGKGRIKEIRKQKKELSDRWGKAVTGEIPLDPYGFPLESYIEEKERETSSIDNED